MHIKDLSLMPDVEEITRQTYDRIAVPYATKTLGSRMRPAICEALEWTATLIRPGGSVLVLGSGDGRDALWFESRGFRTVCVDFSHEMNVLAHATNKLPLTITGDLRRLPLSKMSFDCVWASMCLYHLQRKSMKNCLHEIHSLIRPGGFFYFNLRPGEGEHLDLSPASFPAGGPRFYTYYSARQLRNLVRSFEVLRIQSSHPQLGKYLMQVWVRVPAVP